MGIFKILIVLLLLSLSCFCQAQLSPSFYNQTCPKLFPIIDLLKIQFHNELSEQLSCLRYEGGTFRQCVMKRRLAPALIRLQYLDCFVDGCDASILLDATPTMESEQDSPRTYVRRIVFPAIEALKDRLEESCPGVVSCADIIALAAREAVYHVGGPRYEVKLGRRDSTAAYRALAETDLPNYNATLDELTALFQRKGLTTRELVALSGAHDIGQAQCRTFRDRIYNNSSDINPYFASSLKRICPANGGDTNLELLDEVTPYQFDGSYYFSLMLKRGLLATDQVLYGTGASTDDIVKEYARNSNLFRSDFAAAMIKMGEIGTLTGSQGNIRKVCSKVNT